MTNTLWALRRRCRRIVYGLGGPAIVAPWIGLTEAELAAVVGRHEAPFDHQIVGLDFLLRRAGYEGRGVLVAAPSVFWELDEGRA